MKIKSFSKTDNSLTAVVVDNNNKNVVVRATSAHPGWKDALKALSANDGQALIESCSVGSKIEKFTDANVEVKDGQVFFKGRQLFGLDVTRLIEYIRDGIPYLRLLRFLERKQSNPSYRSVNELYKFLEYREMTLTERGTVIGYKGVRDDYYSIMGNTATVVTSGTVDSTGHILNRVGEKVRCDRSSVCDDYRQGCSPGLHIGSLEYAKGWGPRVMIVEFDPADVVSVPDDCNCQKLRACAYEVIGEFKGNLVTEKAEINSRKESVESVEEKHSDVADETDSDFQNGFNQGVRDGKAHSARKHYETDVDSMLTTKEYHYIKGYNKGYRRGRYGK